LTAATSCCHVCDTSAAAGTVRVVVCIVHGAARQRALRVACRAAEAPGRLPLRRWRPQQCDCGRHAAAAAPSPWHAVHWIASAAASTAESSAGACARVPSSHAHRLVCAGQDMGTGAGPAQETAPEFSAAHYCTQCTAMASQHQNTAAQQQQQPHLSRRLTGLRWLGPSMLLRLAADRAFLMPGAAFSRSSRGLGAVVWLVVVVVGGGGDSSAGGVRGGRMQGGFIACAARLEGLPWAHPHTHTPPASPLQQAEHRSSTCHIRTHAAPTQPKAQHPPASRE
jgi:hypothetical protein